jgi:hypothetical protein
MRSRHRVLALASIAAAGLAAATSMAQMSSPFDNEEVLVIVWAGSKNCSVLDRRTNCSRVASIMTGVLQVGRDRSIVVATNKTDPDTMIRAAQVMTDIRAAGFRRVRPADPPR